MLFTFLSADAVPRRMWVKPHAIYTLEYQCTWVSLLLRENIPLTLLSPVCFPTRVPLVTKWTLTISKSFLPVPMGIVQYYEMYRMVVLLNPSTTIGTNGTDGNLWSRSVKPSLPCVKHVGRHHKGLSIIWSNRADGTDGNVKSRSVRPSLPSVKHVGSHHTGPQSYGRIVRMARMVSCEHDPCNRVYHQ